MKEKGREVKVWETPSRALEGEEYSPMLPPWAFVQVTSHLQIVLLQSWTGTGKDIVLPRLNEKENPLASDQIQETGGIKDSHCLSYSATAKM